MQVKQTVIQSLIKTLMLWMGNGSNFTRMVAEIQRVNELMPDATGEDKKKQLKKHRLGRYGNYIFAGPKGIPPQSLKFQKQSPAALPPIHFGQT